MSEKSLNFKLSKILDVASDEIEKKTEEISKKVASDVAKELQETSPKRASGGEYAKNWSSKSNNGGYVVYNKAPTYRLTHLLENGHIVKNKYGSYGRAKPQPHIANAAEKGQKEMVQMIKEIKL